MLEFRPTFGKFFPIDTQDSCEITLNEGVQFDEITIEILRLHYSWTIRCSRTKFFHRHKERECCWKSVNMRLTCYTFVLGSKSYWYSVNRALDVLYMAANSPNFPSCLYMDVHYIVSFQDASKGSSQPAQSYASIRNSTSRAILANSNSLSFAHKGTQVSFLPYEYLLAILYSSAETL